MDDEYLQKLTEQFVSELAIPEWKNDGGTARSSFRNSDPVQLLWKSDKNRCAMRKSEANKHATKKAKPDTHAGLTLKADSGCRCKTYELTAKKRQYLSIPDPVVKTDDDILEHSSGTSSQGRSPKSAKVKELINIVKMRAKEQKTKDTREEQFEDFSYTPSEHSACSNTTDELRKLVILQCKQLGKITKKQKERRLSDIKEESSKEKLEQNTNKLTEEVHQFSQNMKNQSQQHLRDKKTKTPKKTTIVTASGRSFDMSVDEIINCQTVQPVLSKLQAICLDNVQQTVVVMKSLSQLPKDISKALKGLE